MAQLRPYVALTTKSELSNARARSVSTMPTSLSRNAMLLTSLASHASVSLPVQVSQTRK